MAAVAAIWGSSFLFIEIGLEHFGPGLVAFGRVAIGALTLSLLPRSRRPSTGPTCPGWRCSGSSGWRPRCC